MEWDSKLEEAAQTKYYESTDPDECTGFLYDIGDPKGLFLPKSIKTKRLLGIWAWSTGYITAVHSIHSDDGDASDNNNNNDDNDERSVKSIVVSVLQVTNRQISLVRFFIVKIVSDEENEENEDEEDEDEDSDNERVEPIRCVTCTDWALFILSGSSSVHIVDCRTASEITSVACGPGSYRRVVVSPDLRYMTLVRCGSEAQGITVIDLEKLFRATSSSSALSSTTSAIHAPSSLTFTKHVELTANADGGDPAGADSIPALFASLSRAPDVPSSDAGLSWHEFVASFGGVPVPEMSKPRGVTSITHKGRLKGLSSIPAAPSGFSLGRKAPYKRNYHSVQQKQRIAHWKTCVGKPEGTTFADELVGDTPLDGYCDDNDSIFATPDFVVWLRRRSKRECRNSSSASPSPLPPTEVWIYVRTRGWAPLLHKFGCNPLVIHGSSAWYFIEQRGLAVLIAGQSEQQVISNLTMFDLADKADELCRENAWDSRARRLNTLGTGLRYKQLDVAEHALTSLDRDQHVAGLRLLLDHIKAFSGVPAEEPFNMHLIHLGIKFTTECAISPKVSAGVPEDDAEVQELTGLLKEFRTLAAIYAIRWRNSGGNNRTQKRQGHTHSKQTSAIHRQQQQAQSPPQPQQQQQQQKQSTNNYRKASIEKICKALRPEDLFNPVDTDRWKRMDEVNILRESLLGSHTGAAIGFLRMTRPETGKPTTATTAPPTAQSFTTEWTKLLAAKLAYQSSCDGNYADAVRILDEAGVPSDRALTELLWNTSRRELRNGLMDFLRGRAGAGAPLPPRAFAEYAALVERLHSSASLGDEYERLTSGGANGAVRIRDQHTTARTTDEQPICELCPDLDDLTASVCLKYGFSLAKSADPSGNDEGRGVIAITPSQPSQSSASSPVSASSASPSSSMALNSFSQAATAGYARFSLKQLASWSKTTRERVFMENGYELARRNPKAFVSYALSHNDAGLVAKWVKLFLDPVLGKGPAQDVLRLDAPECAFANTAALAGLSVPPLRSTCAFIREQIAAELAKRGIVLDEEIRLLDGADLFPLVRRVAQGGRLFLPAPSAPAGFDAATLRLLSDIECYPAMMRYFEQHALATLPHEVIPTGTTAPTWTDFFLCVLGGLSAGQSDIAKYDAALAKAAAINASLLPVGRDLAIRPMLALALERYGKLPEGTKAAAAVPKDAFPTLAQTAAALTSPFSEAYSTAGIRDDPNDIYSSNSDASVVSLLHCPALRTISKKVYGASSSALSFATTELANDRFRYALGVSYFLMRGCPLQAKEWAAAGRLSKKDAEQLVYELCCKPPRGAPNADAPSHLLVGASAAFLELWGIDSSELRADAAAIAALAPRHPEQNVAELILSAHNAGNSAPNAYSEQVSGMLEALGPEADALLFSFCAVHNLPPPYAALERLAKEGKWKEFLALSRREGIEPQKVLQIVRDSWNGQSVKEHLCHAFAAAAGDVPDYRAAQKLACSGGGAAIANFLRAVEAVERYGLDPERVGSNADVPKADFVLPLPLVFATGSSDNEAQAIAYMRHKVPSLPCGCTLPEAVVHLIVCGRTWELGCALRTFLAGSRAPLLAVYEFFHSLAMRAAPDATQLRAFLAEDKTRELQDVVISAALGLVGTYASNEDERALDVLLAALGPDGLGVSEQSPELAACCTNFGVLRDSGLPLRLLRERPERIVRELAVCGGQYDRALALAASAGVSAYPVHVARAAEMVAQHKRQQGIWADPTVRMELWHHIHQYFVDNIGTERVAREAASEFFMGRVADEGGTAKEHLELLSFALLWCTNRQGSISIDRGNLVDCIEEMLDSSQSLGADELCKPVEFVKDLEARVTLLRVCIDAGIPVSPSFAAVDGGSGETLSIAVDYLINANRLNSARSLAQRFGFKSASLAAAERMAQIATGGAVGDKPVSVLLSELIRDNRDIEKYGERVLTDCQAAEMLGATYSSISGCGNNEAAVVLARIALMRNSRGNELSRNFISSHGLDRQLVATALASHFVSWLKETYESSKGESLRSVVIGEWPRETLVCYASLSEDVHTVATQLFREVASPPLPEASPLKGDVEVELIISCWTLFEHEGSSAGRQEVIAHIEGVLPRFIAEGEYYLLRRVLTGTCAFRELYSLMDALYTVDQFEVLLTGKARGDPAEDVIGGALLQYMTLRHPDDTDRYQQVCLRFGFFNEIGRRLESAAAAKLSDAAAALRAGQKEQAPAASDALALIGEAINDLLLAADHYTMSQSCQSTRRCFNLALLAALQARHPETSVLGLTRDEARRVMVQQSVLRDAMAIANVYGLQEEWVRPVYAQVVVSGNFPYLDELCYSYNVQPSMWWDISRMYEMDIAKSRSSGSGSGRQQSSHQGVSEAVKAKNMKALLTRIEDYFLQYDIAVKLNFDDISSRLSATVPGIRCFRKT